MSEVVVVGAGAGGLAVAARLVTAGHKVTVCERAEVVGGQLGVVEKATGAGVFRFDSGPSVLTMPTVFTTLFDETGAPLRELVELRRLDPVARYRFADGTRLDAAADLDVFCARLDAALGPGAGADWRRLAARAERLWLAVRDPFYLSPVEGWWSLARGTPVSRELLTAAPGRSLRWLGTRMLRDPRLRVLLDRYATFGGSDPRRAPAALAVLPHVERAYGTWQVRGGLRALVDALAGRVTALGATVRTGTEVVGIDTVGDRVSGVRLAGGERLPADVVVANADATQVYTDLLPRRNLARRSRRADRSPSAFVVLLGVRGRTPHAQAHNVLFPSDPDAEFDALFGEHAVAVPDPTLSVSIPDDPEVRPDGYEAWSVVVSAPRHGSGPGAIDWDSPGLAVSYADRLLGLLARRGMPVADRMIFREIVTPADLERRTRVPGGAIYGTAANGPRGAFLRTPNRSPVPGLYLVGGSAHPGGGLPLAALSARITARLIGPG